MMERKNGLMKDFKTISRGEFRGGRAPPPPPPPIIRKAYVIQR